MNTATLSSKFQISVPKHVREQQNWLPGQKLIFVQDGNHCILVPMPTPNDLFGLAKGANPQNYRDREDRY